MPCGDQIVIHVAPRLAIRSRLPNVAIRTQLRSNGNVGRVRHAKMRIALHFRQPIANRMGDQIIFRRAMAHFATDSIG